MPFTALNAPRMVFAENYFLKISKFKGPIQEKAGGDYHNDLVGLTLNLAKTG